MVSFKRRQEKDNHATLPTDCLTVVTMARYSQKPAPLTQLFDKLPLLQQQQSFGQLQQLNQLLHQVLQQQAHGCQVARIHQGRAVILCQSAAWATRVKMQRDAILANFRQKILPDLAGLDIEITPKASITPPAAKTVMQADPVDGKADASMRLQQLADASSGPLKEHIEQLIRRRNDNEP
ncbi:DciA family protein [Alkalimonas sp. MEB108]|uniref:DciA family protein n=1 Tax=Alkalimonas cellulosilytica TaxID=3058395 RepID=A0ABU7J2Y4_9GAMM|nr:DciA family protein [Alkalimonas sp. MEB108]MEE2000866.1 DciA family protein [Alkalimonas sp. MEB108]